MYAAAVAKAAKRKKKEDDAEFKLPEFSEVDYMRREIQGAKASIMTVILAIPVALVLFAITLSGAVIAAFFLGLALTFLLPRIFKIWPWPKIDVSRFERREWLGHGATFFFSWLAFWILILNVAVVDLTDPVIGGVTVYAGVQTVTIEPGVGRQNSVKFVPDNDVVFNLTIQENVALREARITVGNSTVDLTRLDAARFQRSFQLPAGSYQVEILAVDSSGRTSSFSFRLNLVPV